MRNSLIIIAAWSGVLLLVSLAIVGAFSPLLYEGAIFYSFTKPFIFVSSLLVIAAVTGVFSKRFQHALFWVTAPIHGLLYFPYRFAIDRWPGGDDGPGMAWLFLVGTGSYIAATIATVNIAITARRKWRKRLNGHGR